MSSAASNPPPAGAPTGARAAHLNAAAAWVRDVPRDNTGKPLVPRGAWLSGVRTAADVTTAAPGADVHPALTQLWLDHGHHN